MMANFVGNLNQGVKDTTGHISVFILKVFSSFMVALTISLVLQEMIAFGTFSFVLISVTLLLGLIKMMKRWGVTTVLVFDLICILVALLLRVYVWIAPGG